MRSAFCYFLIAGLVINIAGCTYGPETRQRETYVSPQVQGEAAKINLEEVEKAFFTTKAADFQSWMGAFEKRVNEIYEGPEVVSIAASRETGKLAVTGYIDDQKEPGYQPGESKLFTLEQTGEAVNNEMPYRVANGNGQVYREGTHSIFDNPIIQMMLFANMMNMWGGSYFTPRSRFAGLQDHRSAFRSTPHYQRQRAANNEFQTRFKQRAGGGVASTRPFGGGSTGSASRSRSWSNPSPGVSSPSPWGMRRPTFGGSRRGWGGRRR
jgi:hypothetical protein